MSRIPANLTIPPVGQEANSQAQALGEIDLDQFLRLMITELQNQDPLNPLDNTQMLQQITQIREIGANDRLTETLSAVLTGQNLSTASGLIGKEIDALSDSGEAVAGIVDRVSVETDDNDSAKRVLRVHVGGQSVQLNNIRQIVGA